MENNIYNKDLETSFNNIDLAGDTFLAKWPAWLRWILFLPSAGAFSFLGMMLYRLLMIIFDRYDFSSSIFFEIISMLILGALFVYIGILVAPKHQFIVSIILLVVVVIISVLSFLIGLLPTSETGVFLTLIYDIAMVVGAGYVVVWVKGETK